MLDKTVALPISMASQFSRFCCWRVDGRRTAHAGISWAQERTARPVVASATAHIVDLIVDLCVLASCCCGGEGIGVPGLQSSGLGMGRGSMIYAHIKRQTAGSVSISVEKSLMATKD
jgi:hypothetical protein